MAGAYVAKPADAVTDPTVPPGWDFDWPFCGFTDAEWSNIDPDPFFPAPYPPGYTPEFSLVMTATATIAYNGTASVTGSMRDHDTYVTNEPSAITWTAAINGTAVNLRFSGDEDYESSLSSDVAFSTYWGAAPSIEFNLAQSNVDDTVVLTGISTISGETIIETKEISIIEVALFTSPVSYAPEEAAWSVRWVFQVNSSNPYDSDSLVACDWQRGEGYAPPQIVNEVNNVTETYPYTLPTFNEYAITTVDDNGITISMDYTVLADDQFFALDGFVRATDASISVAMKLVIGDTIYTKTMSAGDGPGRWLKIFNDGSVIIVNP